MRVDYNSKGKVIPPSALFTFKRAEFQNNDGLPDWKRLIEHGDEFGFDLRNVEANGKHTIRVVLPAGKRIVRYGLSGGAYSTDYGTSYSMLSLPYDEDSVPYHEYVVMKDCEIECIVDKGTVAPGFKSVGGGVQYKHYYRINESLERGLLQEDFSWIKE